MKAVEVKTAEFFLIRNWKPGRKKRIKDFSKVLSLRNDEVGDSILRKG